MLSLHLLQVHIIVRNGLKITGRKSVDINSSSISADASGHNNNNTTNTNNASNNNIFYSSNFEMAPETDSGSA